MTSKTVVRLMKSSSIYIQQKQGLPRLGPISRELQYILSHTATSWVMSLIADDSLGIHKSVFDLEYGVNDQG
jgi:hypothetical protein